MRKLSSQLLFVVVCVSTVGGLSSAAQAHSINDCIEAIEDHCWTWYSDDPAELNLCIATGIADCSVHVHVGEPPEPGSDDLSADIGRVLDQYQDLSNRYIQLQDDLIKLRIERLTDSANSDKEK